MKSLVRSVLSRSCWSDVLGPNTEPHPPEGKSSQAAQGVGLSEGDTVIGANDFRESKLLEQPYKDLSGARYRSRQERSAAKQIMRVEIERRERIAVWSARYSQSGLSLEVGGPDHVRL